MADYYTKFSFVIPLPTEAAQNYALELYANIKAYLVGDGDIRCIHCDTILTDTDSHGTWIDSTHGDGCDNPSNQHEAIFDADTIENWCFLCESDGSPSGWGLWIHDDCGAGGIDSAALFCQHLLSKFGTPLDHVGFQWCADCSKPRLDGYGGGAMFITQNAVQSMHTGEWIFEKGKELDTRIAQLTAD